MEVTKKGFKRLGFFFIYTRKKKGSEQLWAKVLFFLLGGVMCDVG